MARDNLAISLGWIDIFHSSIHALEPWISRPIIRTRARRNIERR